VEVDEPEVKDGYLLDFWKGFRFLNYWRYRFLVIEAGGAGWFGF